MNTSKPSSSPRTVAITLTIATSFALAATFAASACGAGETEVYEATQDQAQECAAVDAGCGGGERTYACFYAPIVNPNTEFVCATSKSDAVDNECPEFDMIGARSALPAVCQGLAGGTFYGEDTDSPWEPGLEIDYNSSTDEYEIDEEFFDNMMENATPLLFDSATVEWKNPYYALKNVATGDAVELLGLGNGDKLISVNGTLLKEIEDIGAAVDDYKNDTTLKLKIYSWPAGLRTQDYRVVSSP